MKAMPTSNDFRGRYLVTGGAGFLGSHLCERLLKEGASVLCVDNLSTGRRENIAELLRDSRFEFREIDIVNSSEFKTIKGPFAGIFHLACPASPVDYARLPIETLRVCSEGARHVLELAEASRCPILLASTSEVYGDPEEHPQKESYWGHVNPVGPRACYDEGKRYQEALATCYAKERGVAVRLVRIFNTYGPRMRFEDGRVVPTLCREALEGQPLTVFGDGSQTRSFCYVDDLIEGFLLAFRCDDASPTNLGNSEEFTVLQFAEAVRKLAPKPVEIEFHPLPVDDPRRRRPSIDRARDMLGWTPKVSLHDGLQRTFEWFRSR